MFALGSALDKLVRFFHNGKVCGEVYVEHGVEAEQSESGVHLALYVRADGVAELFAERGADGRSGTYDNYLLGIVYRGAYIVDFALFVQCARRADVNALPACRTGRFGKFFVERTTDIGCETAVSRADYGNVLNRFTCSDAPAAEHAFGVISYKIIGGRIGLRRRHFAPESVHIAIVFVSKFLQFAVHVPLARKAGFVMIGKQQFDSGLSGLTDSRRIGKNFHTLVNGVYARGDKTSCALDLANADTARADLVYCFHIAKRGDFNTGDLSRFEYGRSLGNAYGYIIYFKIYHDHSSLCLSDCLELTSAHTSAALHALVRIDCHRSEFVTFGGVIRTSDRTCGAQTLAQSATDTFIFIDSKSDELFANVSGTNLIYYVRFVFTSEITQR